MKGKIVAVFSGAPAVMESEKRAHYAGQGAKAATTTSLLIVGISSLFGMLSHWRAGRVRIGAGNVALRYFLLPVLQRLRREHPAIELVVSTGNTAEIAQALAKIAA